MDKPELYKNSKKGEIILKVKPYLHNLDELLNEMFGKIVKGIKADRAASLGVYITIKSYGEENSVIIGQIIVTDDDGKLIGRCLLSNGPIDSTIFCENIQENIKYGLPNPDYYLSNIIIITKKVLNTVHDTRRQTIELQANMNLNSTPYDPEISVYRALETINYIKNTSEIRLYNPEIIPLVKY